MSVTVAPARPQKSVSGLQNLKVIVHLDPGVTLFIEHALHSAGSGINKEQHQLVLSAVQELSPHQPVANPTEARDVDVFVVRQMDPAESGARGIQNANPDFRVGIA